jgi:hypothetical protein
VWKDQGCHRLQLPISSPVARLCTHRLLLGQEEGAHCAKSRGCPPQPSPGPLVSQQSLSLNSHPSTAISLKLSVLAEDFCKRASGDLSWLTVGLGKMIGLRETFRVTVPGWELMHSIVPIVEDFLVFFFFVMSFWVGTWRCTTRIRIPRV